MAKKYRCVNFGSCVYADMKKVIEIKDGEEHKCPDCGAELAEIKKAPPSPWYGVLAALVLVVLGVGAFFLLFKGDNKPTDVTIEESSVTLNVGDTQTLTATVYPMKVKSTLIWESSDPSVATVSDEGCVTAEKPGEATITLKVKENSTISDKCKVKVSGEGGAGGGSDEFVGVKSISVMESELAMKEGENLKLDVLVEPENHTDSVRVVSSDETVATISGFDEVRALKTGTATISIIAEKSDVRKDIKLTVESGDILIEALKLSPTSFTLGVGKTRQLAVSAVPSKNTEKIYFKSSNPLIASVSQSGKVIGLKKGTVGIVAITSKSNNEALVNVTVVEGDNSGEVYKFSWGSYTGGKKNGVPHGEGNITIEKTVTLKRGNLAGETITLHKGDRISRAEIRNGYLQTGYFVINGEQRYVDQLNERLK